MNQRLRILHLEDDAADAELVRLALLGLKRPTDVTHVATAAAFRAALPAGTRCGVEPGRDCGCVPERENPPYFDLVLADCSIPGFDGMTALAHVREICAHIPFLFVTGTLEKDRAVAALRAGATDILRKDRLDQLALAVERAMREFHATRERIAAQDALHSRNALLQAISQALALLLEHDNWREAGRVLLHRALAFTGGRAGTIGILTRPGVLCSTFQLVPDAPGSERTEGWVDVPVADDPVGAIVKSGRPSFVRFRTGGAVAGLPAPWPPVEALVGVPFLKGEEVVGVLALGTSAGTGGRRQELALELLAGAGAILAHTHRRALHQEELQAQFLQAQKLEAVGRLAGGVAHDFNNLLSVINGYAELTLDELPEGHPIRGNLELIHRAGSRAAGLTRQLLLFSRKSVTRMVPTRLDDVLRNLLKMLHRLVGEDIRIELELPAELPPVVCDIGQVEQAITNLVVNARDSMERGGTITLRGSEVTVGASASRNRVGVAPGQYVSLAVVDEGCGMDGPTRTRIFEPFFTTKEAGKGTGLGLSTVYSIMQNHQGFVDVASAPGAGSTFTLCLPRSDQAPAAAAAEAARDIAGKERVLVVEDDEELRGLAERILKQAGYAVTTAATGNQAARMFASDPDAMDLVLTDVVMPGMRGDELGELVHASRPGLPVLYMSGYADTPIVPADQLEKLEPLIQKPFSPSKLLRSVREVLDGAS